MPLPLLPSRGHHYGVDDDRIKFGNIVAVKIDELLTPTSFRRGLTPKQREAGRAHRKRLRKLLGQAAGQEAWTQELRAVLPERLGNACRVIDVRGDTLVVACDDGAVATRLRFQAQDIIGKLRGLSEYRLIERIEIGVSRGGG